MIRRMTKIPYGRAPCVKNIPANTPVPMAQTIDLKESECLDELKGKETGPYF